MCQSCKEGNGYQGSVRQVILRPVSPMALSRPQLSDRGFLTVVYCEADQNQTMLVMQKHDRVKLYQLFRKYFNLVDDKWLFSKKFSVASPMDSVRGDLICFYCQRVIADPDGHLTEMHNRRAWYALQVISYKNLDDSESEDEEDFERDPAWYYKERSNFSGTQGVEFLSHLMANAL